MHIIAAKAVALGEALKPEFKAYQQQIVKNARRPGQSPDGRAASTWSPAARTTT